MRWPRGILLSLHLVVGLGGLAGGWAAMKDPFEPLGAPLSLLEHSPFENFFIPGFILFFVIGVGNLIRALLFWKAKSYQVYACNNMGWTLMIWITVQVMMLRNIDFLHILFFLIGILQAAIAFRLLYQEQLFPIPLLLKISKNLRRRGPLGR